MSRESPKSSGNVDRMQQPVRARDEIRLRADVKRETASEQLGSHAVEVRQATISDWPLIATFIEATYGSQARYKAWPRHDWQFLSNPHRSGTGLPLWIAHTPTGRVVGAIGVQPATLHLGGITMPAGWVVDVMVEPEYRGKRLGHRLHAAVAAANSVLVTLTMAEATRRMAEQCGAVTLGEGWQYTRFGSPSAADLYTYLSERARRRAWAARAVSVAHAFRIDRLLAPIARMIGRRIGPTPDPTVTIREVERFGTFADMLWARARGGYPAIFVRDSRHLDWRFGTPPDLVYRRFVAHRNEEPVGLVVLREAVPEELRVGFISEIFALRDDEAAWRSLMHHAVRTMRTRLALIEGAASTVELQSQFRAFGFVPTHRVRPTVVATDPAIRQAVEESKSDWFFTKGDHDWDQIHPLGHT